MTIHRSYMKSPVGPLEIQCDTHFILAVRFVDQAGEDDPHAPPCASAGRGQLEAYFSGTRRRFELELYPRGTPFQQRVWQCLLRIPYGRTVSYGEVAAGIGRPTAVRAVGGANGRNPIPIVIPCHRVIGSDGRLTGYGSGLWRKQWLLDHEKQWLPGSNP